MKNSVLTNQKAIRGGRQPITSENNETECESLKEIDHAATSIKQTIEDILNKQGVEMSADESESQQLAIKPPVKRPFTIALIDNSSNIPLKSSIRRIGEKILAGTYEHDSLLQTVISLLK